MNARAGQAFADFLVSAEGQRAIGEFGKELLRAVPVHPGCRQEGRGPAQAGRRMAPSAWEYWADLGDGLVAAVVLLVTGDPETWERDASIARDLVERHRAERHAWACRSGSGWRSRRSADARSS